MHFDFAAALVLAASITGGVLLLDKLVLSGRRTATADAPLSRAPWYVEYSRSFFPVILIVLVLRSFAVEPFRIPSGSMMPTLLAGDFILVNKFAYGVRLPVLNQKVWDRGPAQRGDVAVFRYPEDPSIAFIKRIVGVPGDKLQYVDKVLYVNGEPAQQTTVPNGAWEPQSVTRLEKLGSVEHEILVTRSGPDWQWEFEVPDGHYFVLGDNRDRSRDSRFWGFLPDENLIGRAFMIWMNWDCITGNGQCVRIGNMIR